MALDMSREAIEEEWVLPTIAEVSDIARTSIDNNNPAFFYQKSFRAVTLFRHNRMIHVAVMGTLEIYMKRCLLLQLYPSLSAADEDPAGAIKSKGRVREAYRDRILFFEKEGETALMSAIVSKESLGEIRKLLRNEKGSIQKWSNFINKRLDGEMKIVFSEEDNLWLLTTSAKSEIEKIGRRLSEIEGGIRERQKIRTSVIDELFEN